MDIDVNGHYAAKKQNVPEDTTAYVSSPTRGLGTEIKVRKLRGAVKTGIIKENGSQGRQNGRKG